MPAAVFLGSVLPSFLVTLFSYSLFAKIKDEKSGFFIALFICTAPFFIGASLVLRMDMLMNFFIFMALYTFFSIYYEFISINFKNIIFIYLFIFLGIFTKGIAGAAVPVITILVFLALENNLKFLKKIYIGRGIIFLSTLVGVWWYTVLQFPQGKEYLSLILGQETVGRIVKAKTHIKPFYYYIKMLPAVFYPYGFFLLGSFFYYMKNIKIYKNWEPVEKIGFAWTAVPLAVFSCASGKLDVYLIPLFTGMAVITYSFIIKSKDTKLGNILLKISMAAAVLPLLLNKIFNKENNFYKKIMFFPVTVIIIFTLLAPFTGIYNNKFSLKPIEREINFSDKILAAYKFKDFVNINGKIHKEIILFENAEELQQEILKNNNILIISRKKYKNDLEKFPQLEIKYENKNYSIFQIK